MSEVETKKIKQASASRVIERIMWDEFAKHVIHQFCVGYIDRFLGIIEKSFGEFNFTVDICSVDLRDVFTIPEHRIQYFKFADTIIWDKRDGCRLDEVFGSLGGNNLRDTLAILGIDPPTEENQQEPPPPPKPKKQPHLGRLLYNLNRRKSHRDLIIPTHFIHIPITNSKVLQNIEACAKAITSANTALSDTIIPTYRTHLTLCTLRLDSKHDLWLTAQVLRECQQELSELLSTAMNQQPETEPVAEVVGLDSFGNRVVYAAVKSDVIVKIQTVLQARLMDAGVPVRIEDRGDADIHQGSFVPHITVAKLNAQVMKEGMNTIPPQSWQYRQHTPLGSFVPSAIHLCEMPWAHVPFPLPKSKSYHVCESISLLNAHPSVGPSPTPSEDVTPTSTQRVVIFDFDGSLFQTLVPSKNLWTPNALKTLRKSNDEKGVGWFEMPQLLQEPYSSTSHMVEVVANEAKKWISLAKAENSKESSVTTALVTGRTESCRAAVTELLLNAGLAFDHMFFRPDKIPTLEYKMGMVDRLIRETSRKHSHGSSEQVNVIVEIFDDNDRFLQSAIAHNRAAIIVHNPNVMVNTPTERTLPRDQELEIVTAAAACISPKASNKNKSLCLVPRLAFTAIVLDNDNKYQLLKVFPRPEEWWVHVDHVTLSFGVEPQPHQQQPHQQHQQRKRQRQQSRQRVLPRQQQIGDQVSFTVDGP
eukprot:c13126_g1_i1.p1 GENE.c13126_g1_i1~~c13126_g1_i1.p1  ORF type:complete len:701 (+),score=179.22 c13126_g1_i1:56-2158(+)